ncbi:unnamed protein product, partial [Discosporangium mesarthrocarpum]
MGLKVGLTHYFQSVDPSTKISMPPELEERPTPAIGQGFHFRRPREMIGFLLTLSTFSCCARSMQVSCCAQPYNDFDCTKDEGYSVGSSIYTCVSMSEIEEACMTCWPTGESNNTCTSCCSTACGIEGGLKSEIDKDEENGDDEDSLDDAHNHSGSQRFMPHTWQMYVSTILLVLICCCFSVVCAVVESRRQAKGVRSFAEAWSLPQGMPILRTTVADIQPRSSRRGRRNLHTRGSSRGDNSDENTSPRGNPSSRSSGELGGDVEGRGLAPVDTDFAPSSASGIGDGGGARGRFPSKGTLRCNMANLGGDWLKQGDGNTNEGDTRGAGPRAWSLAGGRGSREARLGTMDSEGYHSDCPVAGLVDESEVALAFPTPMSLAPGLPGRDEEGMHGNVGGVGL